MGFLAPAAAAVSTFLTSTAGVLTTAAATAAATGYSAYESSQASKYQGAVAAQNAKIEEQNRQAALEEGAAAESASRTATGRRIGAALAAQGANGVDVGYGSAFEQRGALAAEGDMDALAIRYNATRRSLGALNVAAGYKGDASMARAASKNALIGGALDVGASFLSSSSSIQRRSTARSSVGLG